VPEPEKKTLTRRDFLWQGLFWAGLWASLLSVLRYLQIPSRHSEIKPVSLLFPAAMELNTVQAFPAYQIWLVRSPEGFYALRSICTHMGCLPDWKPQAQEFHCPCHHSVFDLRGLRQRGPALRALERHRLFWGPQGEIMLDRSVIYRHELEGWAQPGALLPFQS